MLELIRFCHGGVAYYRGMLLILPWLVLMKLRIMANHAVKERLLTHFFGGMPLIDFNHHCDRFISQKLPGLIRRDALAKIQEHLSGGHEVVVVSASAENWISGWCSSQGLFCIATRLAVKDQFITGKLEGLNCNGAEKVNRIRHAYNLMDYGTVYCYGDTPGDKPMLQIASKAFYRVFSQ